MRLGARSLGLCVVTLTASAAIRAPGLHGQEPDGFGFASFDIGMGGVQPVDGDLGVSYGAGTDLRNLLIRGASLHLGFRFWSADDAVGDRLVEIDDFVLPLVFRKRLTAGGVSPFVGIGPAFHIVSARFQSAPDEEERRDGLRPALEGLAGVDVPVGDGFVNLYLEAWGTLAKRLVHGAVHAGLRLRFDRLGRTE